MGLDDARTQIRRALDSNLPTTWADFKKWFGSNIDPLLPDRTMLQAEFDVALRNANTKIRNGENESSVISGLVSNLKNLVKPVDAVSVPEAAEPGVAVQGSSRRTKLGNKFNRCVKSVRATVRARKGSTKESAAIAICTKSVLQTRGKTMKRYRKGRLVTQKKFRGGATACS